jgi:hypothetical protein
MIQILDKLQGSKIAAIFRRNWCGGGDFHDPELHGKKRKNARKTAGRGCSAIFSHR